MENKKQPTSYFDAAPIAKEILSTLSKYPMTYHQYSAVIDLVEENVRCYTEFNLPDIQHYWQRNVDHEAKDL